MKYLSFVFFKEYFYFIAYWIISIISSLINHYFQKQIQNDENANKKEYNTIYLLCFIIGDLLGGFLVLYTYFSSKPEKEESKEKKNEIKNNLHYELIFNDLSVKKYKYRLILTISILHFIALSSDLFFYLIFVEKTLAIEEIEWLISIELLARIIFCRFILKIRLYKHHILSIIISMTGFLFMGITGLVKTAQRSEIEKRGFYILFTIISEILISLEDVLCNVLLIEKFMLPHILMFFRGIIDFIIFIILIPILNASGAISLKHYHSFFLKSNKSLFIFLKILLIIFAFIKGFITMKVIYIFNPQHVAFLNIVFYLYEFIKYMISPDDNNSIIVLPDIFDIFFLIIIIIGTLIFNEMIIIKAFGFDEETKKGLLIKEQVEEKNERNDSFSTTNEYNLQESVNNQNEDSENNSETSF
jgi:flagellar basal body-associated protein FliL